MKIHLISLLLCLISVSLFAEETNAPSPAGATTNADAGNVASNAAPNAITIDGTTYEDVRWGRLTPVTVTLYHRTGIATVPLASLPADLQKQFGYDPQKAAAWQADADKAAASKLAAEQKAEAARETAEREIARRKVDEQKAAAASKTNEEKQTKSPTISSTTTNVVQKKRTITNPTTNLPRTTY